MKNYVILTRIGWAAAAGWLSSPWTALLKALCRFSRSPSISKSQHTPPLTGSRPGKRRHLWISFKTCGILFCTAILFTLLYFSTKNWLLSRSTKAYRSAKMQKIGSKNAVWTSPEKCTETVNLSKLWKWVYSLLQFNWMWMIKRLPLTINERSRWFILSHYF